MRNIFVAFICAFIVTAAALDSSKKTQNKKLPKVVAIEDNGEKFCTGVMLIDKTILTMSNCFEGYEDEKSNLTVKFPDDGKPYKAKFKYTDEEKAKKFDSLHYYDLLVLDEKDNPPKCEWTFQILKSDRKGGKGQMIVIRKNKDKYEEKVTDLTIEKCHVEDPETYSLSDEFCSKGKVAIETDFVDQGAPLLFDGILAGMMISPGYPGRPNLFDDIISVQEPLEKLLKDLGENKNSSGNKKSIENKTSGKNEKHVTKGKIPH